MKKYLLLAVVIIFSSWTWGMLRVNILVGLVSIVLSFLLFDYLTDKKKSKPKNLLLLGLSLVVSVFLFFTSYDQQLIRTSDEEISRMGKREVYYIQNLGRLYGNRFGLLYFNKLKPISYKYLNNIAHTLDLETYYFPRVVDGVERARFPLVFLPLMLVGLYHVLKDGNKWEALYLIAVGIILGLVDAMNILGPVIVYPLITASIGLGMVKVFNWKK